MDLRVHTVTVTVAEKAAIIVYRYRAWHRRTLLPVVSRKRTNNFGDLSSWNRYLNLTATITFTGSSIASIGGFDYLQAQQTYTVTALDRSERCIPY